MAVKTEEYTFVPDETIIENVSIDYRNFSGIQLPFNDRGKRNFVVVLSESLARDLESKGWNIRWQKRQPPYDDEPPRPILKVHVNYSGRTEPQVYLITSKGKTKLSEDLLPILDGFSPKQILNVDLQIRPWRYRTDEPNQISAYLQSMWVTIQENRLEEKYADIPDTEGASGDAQSMITFNPEEAGN